MRAIVSILVFSCLTPFASLWAQVQQRIEPGTRVRATATDLGLYRQTASFEAVTGEILVIVTDSTMNCPLSSVTRLDVHRGRKSHIVEGAVAGFALTGVGAFMGWRARCVWEWDGPCHEMGTVWGRTVASAERLAALGALPCRRVYRAASFLIALQAPGVCRSRWLRRLPGPTTVG
jgi:DNA-directed RNA polymerase subunit N (RpoN/RPB10)